MVLVKSLQSMIELRYGIPTAHRCLLRDDAVVRSWSAFGRTPGAPLAAADQGINPFCNSF